MVFKNLLILKHVMESSSSSYYVVIMHSSMPLSKEDGSHGNAPVETSFV
jgi:hypothetical protein